jgi:hypothetical protein
MKPPPEVRSSALERIDRGLFVILCTSFVVHFGCVGWLRTLDFPRRADADVVVAPKRAVSFRPPPQEPKPTPKADVPEAPPKMAAKPALRGAPKAHAAVDRASLREAMRAKGLLSVLTSRGEEPGVIADVLKGGAPPLTDDAFKKLGGVQQVRSDEALLEPRERESGRHRAGDSLIARGPDEVRSGERTSERRAERVVEVDETEVRFGGDPPEGVVPSVRAQMRAIRACWQHAVQLMVQTGGRIELALEVAASGEVARAHVERDTISDVGLRVCIEQRAARFVLPAAAKPYRFTLPLIFVSR